MEMYKNELVLPLDTIAKICSKKSKFNMGH